MKTLSVWLVGVLAVLASGGCSTKAKLVVQGGECLQATDCVDGLVCVPQKDGRKLCDSDLSGVQTTEDAAGPPVADAGRRDGAADAISDAPTPPGDAADDTAGGTDAATD